MFLIVSQASSHADKLTLSRFQLDKQWRTMSLELRLPFRASVVDVAPKSITIQVTGDGDKIDALLRVVKPYGIQNLARTGATGFSRDFSC